MPSLSCLKNALSLIAFRPHPEKIREQKSVFQAYIKPFKGNYVILGDKRRIEIFYFAIFITNTHFWTQNFSKTAKIKRIFNHSGDTVYSLCCFLLCHLPKSFSSFKFSPKLENRSNLGENLHSKKLTQIWVNYPNLGIFLLLKTRFFKIHREQVPATQI